MTNRYWLESQRQLARNRMIYDERRTSRPTPNWRPRLVWLNAMLSLIVIVGGLSGLLSGAAYAVLAATWAVAFVAMAIEVRRHQRA